MSKFYVKIISSDRIFYEGFCHCLIVPAVDGEQAIMAHHEETIIAVQNGEMRMQKEEGRRVDLCSPWKRILYGSQQPCYSPC